MSHFDDRRKLKPEAVARSPHSAQERAQSKQAVTGHTEPRRALDGRTQRARLPDPTPQALTFREVYIREGRKILIEFYRRRR